MIELAIGPIIGLKCFISINSFLLPTRIPLFVHLLSVGLKPRTPVKLQGTVILPPRSLPNPKGMHLEDTKPHSPPELPPHVLSLFQGFFDEPHILFSECKA